MSLESLLVAAASLTAVVDGSWTVDGSAADVRTSRTFCKISRRPEESIAIELPLRSNFELAGRC